MKTKFLQITVQHSCLIVMTVFLGLLANPVMSAEFTKGPLIPEYGANAVVEQTTPLTGAEKFRVVFDAVDQAKEGKLNRSFESLARFLNMQVRAGVKPEDIELALVVHGKAGFDLVKNSVYQQKFGKPNANLKLIDELLKHQTRVIICGQSAASLGIENDQLHPGVEVALSAMTAHALLQQNGYTLNPF